MVNTKYMPTGIYKRTREMYIGRGEKIASTRRKNNSYIVSNETKEKIRQHNFKTGKRPPSTLGTILTEEHRKKISDAMIKKGHTPPSALGLKRSQEFKDRVSLNHAKYWLGKRGVETAHYIDGRALKNDKIRGSIEMDVWKKEVFKQDNYTCQKYGIRGCRITAHHIINFSSYPKGRFDVSNGITLSDKAHKEFHKKYGKKNNNREQLEEFLLNKKEII